MIMFILGTDDDIIYDDKSSATFRLVTSGATAIPSGFRAFGAVDLIVPVHSKL